MFLDRSALRRRRGSNAAVTALLALALAALLGLIGWLFAGPTGVVWVVLLGVGSLVLRPGLAPAGVLRWMGARELAPHHELTRVVGELARRAGLERSPRVFVYPAAGLNAFAMGGPDNAAITVTRGLVQALDRRELAGVLAHEVSHVAHGDMLLLGMAGRRPG